MKNILLASFFLTVQLFSVNTAFAKAKETRQIASDIVISETWEGIPQDKELIKGLIAALNNEPRIRNSLSSTREVLAVYELGMKYRCQCFDFIVKFKDQDEIWFEAGTSSQGKIKWGIGLK